MRPTEELWNNNRSYEKRRKR